MERTVATVSLRVGAKLTTPHAVLQVLSLDAQLPRECEVTLTLADGSRAAYSPVSPGDGAARELDLDLLQRGNAFHALHESPRALAAQLSIAAGRRMESGPESERMFLFLRGNGLVFLENGDTQRFEPQNATLAPAGEAIRIWAQGPEDVLAVVLQPRMPPAAKRTLASEVAARRQRSEGGTGSL